MSARTTRRPIAPYDLKADEVFRGSCDHAVHAACARQWAFGCTGCGVAVYSCPLCRETQPFSEPARRVESCGACRNEEGGGDDFAFDADFLDSTPEVYRGDLRGVDAAERREFQRIARTARQAQRAARQ